MASQSVLAKKKRGPAPTGKGQQVVVRLQPDLLAFVDTLRNQRQPVPSRPEAIRQILAAVQRMAGFTLIKEAGDG